MYAIVEISGKQFKVEEKSFIVTPKLAKVKGEKVQFDKVLLLKDKDGNTKVGTPVVKGVAVTGTIDEHYRDKKIIVFKKKRRKGYKKMQGHRQDLCKVYIDTISI